MTRFGKSTLAKQVVLFDRPAQQRPAPLECFKNVSIYRLVSPFALANDELPIGVLKHNVNLFLPARVRVRAPPRADCLGQHIQLALNNLPHQPLAAHFFK